MYLITDSEERLQNRQGWARDVKARDQDETETLISQDRDYTETSASPAETRR